MMILKWMMTIMSQNLDFNHSISSLEQSYILYCAGKWNAFIGLEHYLRTYAHEKIKTFEDDGENVTLELFSLKEDNVTLFLVGTEANILFASKNYEVAFAVYQERMQCIEILLKTHDKGEK